ncbi:MAG: hypothetical protein WDN67_04140 [Candidatus Moraniibacteriota bacterium]
MRGEGEKSLAFHLEFGSDERTLTMQEVEEAFRKMADHVTEKTRGRLRS